YNQLYQDLKQYSKNGDYFFKELLTVFQQAELELTYSKGLTKLAGKLIKACQGSTYTAWCQLSDEMYSRADAHTLGNAFHQEATVEIRQVLDEHTRRKRPLDNAIERTGKLFTANWNEQIKLKKRLHGLTREHEALFNYLENNKHISTEKEKQKMLNRLTKSAEQQSQVDEHYYSVNMEGHQMRLKWQNTLKNCYQSQITQELEKHRIEVLCKLLSRYNLHMSTFSQTLKHGQKLIEQTVKRVDMDKDMQTLIDESCNIDEDNKIEFLMADYFEEDTNSRMTKERRGDAIKLKLKRLEESIAKTKKDGIEKLMKTYGENPSFSNQKNLEETEEQHDESTLKLDLLEATHYKLSLSLSESEEKPKTFSRFSGSIFKWKDKECEHSIVQLTRPVKLRRTPLRNRQSLRASVIYKGPVQTPTETAEMSCSIGKCKALYSFTPQHDDELPFKEDVLDIYKKEENGWWVGALNGKKGHFPSTYVEELPTLNTIQSSDA
uniref:Osteoclast-stimulating factor 1 n=1 Tax=Cyprinodon variegatus TaxID=28743 RepID=A0A3Q2C995_CYPVA